MLPSNTFWERNVLTISEVHYNIVISKNVDSVKYFMFKSPKCKAILKYKVSFVWAGLNLARAITGELLNESFLISPKFVLFSSVYNFLRMQLTWEKIFRTNYR